jgi:hypothetical protein
MRDSGIVCRIGKWEDKKETRCLILSSSPASSLFPIPFYLFGFLRFSANSLIRPADVMTGDLRVYQADESNDIETSNTKIRGKKEDTKNLPNVEP